VVQCLDSAAKEVEHSGRNVAGANFKHHNLFAIFLGREKSFPMPGWLAVSMKKKRDDQSTSSYVIPTRVSGRSLRRCSIPPQKDTWRPNWISLGGSTFDVICPAPATPIKLLGTL
jgi:hypothetical protein